MGPSVSKQTTQRTYVSYKPLAKCYATKSCNSEKRVLFHQAMVRHLLPAPVRADLVVHVSPVDGAVDGRLVTAAALVLKHGASAAASIGGRDDIVPDTVDVVADTVLDARNSQARATEVGMLAHVDGGSPGLEGLGTELSARGADGSAEDIGVRGDGVGGTLDRLGNDGVVVPDLGHGGGREGESEDLGELHGAGGFGESFLG